MKITLLVGILGFLCFAVAFSGAAQEAKEFRIISIPAKDRGYGKFETQVFETRPHYSGFMRSVHGRRDLQDAKKFIDVVVAANVDFSREALVLVRQSEPQGSYKVKFGVPKVQGDTLHFTIDRQPPGTDDIAEYCFAVVFDKTKIRTIQIDRVTTSSAKTETTTQKLTVEAK